METLEWPSWSAIIRAVAPPLSSTVAVVLRQLCEVTQLHRESVPLAELATSAAVGARLSTTGGVQVVVDLEPVTAHVDPVRIRQVLDNLLDNAARAVPPGGTVTVGLRRDGDTGASRLTVSDEGPGFPPEFLEHAFQRFTRADPARGSAHGGAGLGLAIVDEVVRAHGGSVTARNRAAGGATVTVTLPADVLPNDV